MALPKPDPSRYRGGQRSRTYQEDLAAWQATQTPEPEEVVSLDSSFDTEADPFAVEFGAGSGYRGEPEEVQGQATGYREQLDPFDAFSRVFITGSDLGKVDMLSDPKQYAEQMESSYLPYIAYDEEMMADIYFQTAPEIFRQQALAQSASGSSWTPVGRRAGGDLSDYSIAYLYNQMISRGVDPEIAIDWYENSGDELEGRELLGKDFIEKKENFTAAMDNLREEDISAFTEKYEELDFGQRVVYLQELQKRGEIEKEDYEEAWRNEWNLSQKGKANPLLIVEAPAPAAVPAAGVEKGEMALISYRPDANPMGDPTWSVIDSDTYYVPETEAQYKRENLNELRYYDNLRPVGDSPPIEYSAWNEWRDEFLLPGIRTFAALYTGGASERLYSAVRLASGETLHGSDYANLALGGLEQAGVITPDATAIDPTTGQEILVPGTGLGSLTYDQTTGLIDAIGNQDVLGAALALEGDSLITDNLEAIGIPPALATDPDFIEGTKTALETAIAGGDFQEALEDGLAEYITEGGGFGGVPDIDVGDLSSVLDPIVDVVENVGDALQPVFDGVEDVAQVVGDIAEDVLIDPADDIIDLLGSEVVDPILQTVEPVAEVVEDTIIDPIDDALDYVGSEFVDPTLQTAEDVAQEVGDVIEDVSQGVGDVVENIVEAIPDVDLPQVTMPSFMPAQREATRTTDTLFKDMLQFETEITEAPRLQIPKQRPAMPVAQAPTAPMLPQTNILEQFIQPQRLLTGRRV